jgi:glycine hydroxymethyltransferase
MTLLDWKVHGPAYAAAMAATAKALAEALVARGVPVFAKDRGLTTSHQFAVEAASCGGGQRAARLLRQANILSCGIGLPIAPVEGDANGLRLGTPEIVRWGMQPSDMPQLATFIATALKGEQSARSIAGEVTAFRRQFQSLHFIR